MTLTTLSDGMKAQDFRVGINNNFSIVNSNVNQGGATASRPATPENYVCYFDTSLSKPIWYDGTKWVDATGTAV